MGFLMNILVESMHKIDTPLYNIRVWVQEEDVESQDCGYIKNKVIELYNKKRWHIHGHLAKEILEFNDVNAVEVLDKGGFGIILYKNWP